MSSLTPLLAQQVADELGSHETAIDHAMISGCRFVTKMLTVRLEAGLAATVGQGAIERAIGSLAKIAEARRDTVNGHKLLDEVRERFGVGIVAGGDKSPHPENPGGYDPDSRHPLPSQAIN